MADKISKPPASALPEVDRQFATTLARGLGILRCFTSAEPALGNKEISTRTRLPKATISRLTYTLTKLGYLRQEKQSRKYQLGPAAVTFAYPVLASLRIRQIARKLMQSLADYSGGAVAMGMCDRLIDMSLTYARERKQFGQPIANFQLVQAMLADCKTDALAAEGLMKAAAERFDAGQNVSLEAAVAKYFASEAVGRIADRAVQIHGGAGYMAEYKVERFYRDVRLLRIYEGTSQIQQTIIARQMVRRAEAEG